MANVYMYQTIRVFAFIIKPNIFFSDLIFVTYDLKNITRYFKITLLKKSLKLTVKYLIMKYIIIGTTKNI